MNHRIAAAGYSVLYDPNEDTINCFYRAAAYQLGIGWLEVKTKIFKYLKDPEPP